MHRRQFASSTAASLTAGLAFPGLVAAGDRYRPKSGTAFENEVTTPDLGATFGWTAPWTGEDAGNDVASSGLETYLLSTDDLVASIWLNAVSVEFHGTESALLDAIEASLDQDTLETTMSWAENVQVVHLDRTEGNIIAVIAYGAANSVMAEYREIRLVNRTYAVDVSVSAPIDEILDWFDTARETVAIDGSAPFAAIDRDELAGFLDEVDIAAGSNQHQDDDDPDEGDPGGASALADVRDHFDTLHGTPDEFLDIVSTETISDTQADRANAILGLWLDAPAVAGNTTIPAEFGEVEVAYLSYTDALAEAATQFVTVIADDSTDAQREQAFDAFNFAIDNATTLEQELDALLTNAGA